MVLPQIVFLMVRFRRIKSLQRLYRGKDSSSERLLHLAEASLRREALLLVRSEDSRAVLRRPRPGGRIVAGPENIQQLRVGYYLRVEIDLKSLRMIADILIGRIRRCSPRIADARAEDAFKKPEPGIRPPESAKGERRGLDGPRDFVVQRRPYGRERPRPAEQSNEKNDQHSGNFHLSHLLQSLFSMDILH